MSLNYHMTMRYYFFKPIIVAILMSLPGVTLMSIADAKSGFHAKSENLPATLNKNSFRCRETANKKGKRRVYPGPEYIPGRNVSGAAVAPAESDPAGTEAYPVVRFDLGFDRRLRRRIKSFGLKQGRLRATDLSAGEVSIDTSSGEVVLDGRALTQTGDRVGCRTQRP